MSKTIEERIKNGEVIEYNSQDFKPQKKKNTVIRIITWPIRVIMGMFGCDWDLLKDSKIGSSSARNHHNHGHSHGTSPSDFRNSQKTHESPFSPYGYDPVQAENLKLYLKSMDGKGDHDCDHHH